VFTIGYFFSDLNIYSTKITTLVNT